MSLLITKVLSATTVAVAVLLDVTTESAPEDPSELLKICYEPRGVVIEAEAEPTVCEEVRGYVIMPTAKPQCIEFRKDADAVKDFWIDWKEMLESGETIASSSWSAETGIVVDSSSWTGTVCTVWLSSGTNGTTYVVTNTIITSDSHTYNGQLKIKVMKY